MSEEEKASYDALVKAEKQHNAIAKIEEKERTPEQTQTLAETLPLKQKLAQMRDNAPKPDRRMAAMLVKRDTFNLADSLAPLLGTGPAKYIFGLGVVAMTLNAATMLMLINGLCLCEMFGKPAKGKLQLIGSLIPAIGVLGAFFWDVLLHGRLLRRWATGVSQGGYAGLTAGGSGSGCWTMGSKSRRRRWRVGRA